MSPESSRKGVAFGIAAYGMWGLIPVYFKAVSAVPAIEVLAHRLVWSVVILVPLLFLRGKWSETRRALASRTTMTTLVLTTLLIAANWFLFIWAVAHDRILEASLGYFINRCPARPGRGGHGGAAVVLHERGAVAAPGDAGLSPVPFAERSVPARGAGLRRTADGGPSPDLRLHLGRSRDLHRRSDPPVKSSGAPRFSFPLTERGKGVFAA